MAKVGDIDGYIEECTELIDKLQEEKSVLITRLSDLLEVCEEIKASTSNNEVWTRFNTEVWLCKKFLSKITEKESN